MAFGSVSNGLLCRIESMGGLRISFDSSSLARSGSLLLDPESARSSI